MGGRRVTTWPACLLASWSSPEPRQPAVSSPCLLLPQLTAQLATPPPLSTEMSGGNACLFHSLKIMECQPEVIEGCCFSPAFSLCLLLSSPPLPGSSFPS